MEKHRRNRGKLMRSNEDQQHVFQKYDISNGDILRNFSDIIFWDIAGRWKLLYFYLWEVTLLLIVLIS